jgi:hypothetical protein
MDVELTYGVAVKSISRNLPLPFETPTPFSMMRQPQLFEN